MCDEPECISDGIVSYTETAMKAATLRHAAEAQEARESRKTCSRRSSGSRTHAAAPVSSAASTCPATCMSSAKMLTRASDGRAGRPGCGTMRRLESVENLDGRQRPLEKGDEAGRMICPTRDYPASSTSARGQ
jgi:hypothetical protein